MYHNLYFCIPVNAVIHCMLCRASFINFIFGCIYAKKIDVAGESSSETPIEVFQILAELLRFLVFKPHFEKRDVLVMPLGVRSSDHLFLCKLFISG